MPVACTINHISSRVYHTGITPVASNDVRSALDQQALDEEAWRYATILDCGAADDMSAMQIGEYVEHLRRLERTHGPHGPTAIVGANRCDRTSQFGMPDVASCSIADFESLAQAESWFDQI